MNLKQYSDEKAKELQAEGESKFKTLVKDPLHARIEFCRGELPFREKQLAAANVEVEKLLGGINWKAFGGVPASIESELNELRQLPTKFSLIKDAIKKFDQLAPRDICLKDGRFDRNAPDRLIALIAPKLDLILSGRGEIRRIVDRLKMHLANIEDAIKWQHTAI
jgi:hypothetical protein